MPVLRDRAPEGHLVLSGISWQTYLALLKDLEPFPGVRVAYDQGVLEIVSPSKLHEVFKSLIGRMLETMTLELDIECQSAGSTTWRREDLEKGIEPDECYYLANEPRVRGKDHADLTVDPPPDLAIEVDLGKSGIDKLAIHAALGVPEVWKFDGQRMRAYVLQPDRTYQERRESASFPFLAVDELSGFLARRSSTGETALIREFRDWVRARSSQHPPR